VKPKVKVVTGPCTAASFANERLFTISALVSFEVSSKPKGMLDRH
jgi:hypothetical protein